MVKIKRYCAIFLISLVVGVITGSLFKSSYFNELKSAFDVFGENVSNYSLYMGKEEKLIFFLSVMIKRMLPFVLLWILAERKSLLTAYIMWLCLSNGYMLGFIGRFFFAAFGGRGAGMMAAFYMPHYIFYIAAYGINVMYMTLGVKKKKTVVGGLLMIVGILFETYINPGIISGVFNK